MKLPRGNPHGSALRWRGPHPGDSTPSMSARARHLAASSLRSAAPRRSSTSWPQSGTVGENPARFALACTYHTGPSTYDSSAAMAAILLYPGSRAGRSRPAPCALGNNVEHVSVVADVRALARRPPRQSHRYRRVVYQISDRRRRRVRRGLGAGAPDAQRQVALQTNAFPAPSRSAP